MRPSACALPWTNLCARRFDTSAPSSSTRRPMALEATCPNTATRCGMESTSDALDERLVTREFLQKIMHRLFVIRRMQHPFAQHAEMVRKILRGGVHVGTTPSRKPRLPFPQTLSTFLPCPSSAPLPRRCLVRRRICGRPR